MRQLTNFTIGIQDEDFVLRLEGDDGETAVFAAAPEQIENLIVALDELLADDEDEDDQEIYQKPLG